MTPESFERELRECIHREPFVPFLIELHGGRKLTIDRPAVAVNNGGAGFISDEEGLIDFEAGDVQRIVIPTGEAAR